MGSGRRDHGLAVQSERDAAAREAARVESRHDAIAARGQAPTGSWNELEITLCAATYGCVVRVDADAQMQNKPALKLYRFADRRRAGY